MAAKARAKLADGRLVYETPQRRMMAGKAEQVLAGPLFRPWRGRVNVAHDNEFAQT